MKLTARAAALEILESGGAVAEHLDRVLRARQLDTRDGAFATELAYGTLKMRRALTWSVEQCLTRPFSGVEPYLQWVLLLGAYQILYLDRVPAHSAVDEAVRLARSRGNTGSAGFANAVLRKLAATRPLPPLPSGANDAAGLGLHASLPDWIARHLIDRFGFALALQAAKGMNGPPRRAVRCNVGETVAGDLTAELAAGGASARAGRYEIPECVVVESAGDGKTLRAALEAGKASYQSEESQLAVHLLDPKPGEIILDICAGRGVKTAMIAGRLGGSGRVWAIEDDAAKMQGLERLAGSADRSTEGRSLQPSVKAERSIRPVRSDARVAYPEDVPEDADAALVDAPCSGIGVLGRHPDARWRKEQTDPLRLAPVQSAILRQAAAHVRPGGRLLYATCSTHPAEGEAVIDAFLGKHDDWSAQPLRLAIDPAVLAIGHYDLTVPGIDGADGFFYALLRRRSTTA